MPQVAKLNGEFPAAQPREDELAGDYRARLAEELGIAPERVGLLGAQAAVPNSAELSRYGDRVLQVVLCPSDETIAGWTVQMLLNELCSSNTRTEASRALVNERLAAIEILQAEELKSAIGVIVTRALEEPSTFKACADVAVALNARWPELPQEGATPGEDGKVKPPKTFKDALFASLSEKFSVLRKAKPPAPANGDGGAVSPEKHRERALALMSFFGQLFVRQVMDMQGLNLVAHELIGRDDREPGDHQMECVVQLFTVAGKQLDAAPSGRPAMSHWVHRMIDLASWAEQNGADIFSHGVLVKADELIKLRRSNWGEPLSGFA